MNVPKSSVDPVNHKRNRGSRPVTALARLGVTEAKLALAAPISDLLSEAVGGRPSVIKAMRFSEDQVIKDFFECYDQLPIQDRDSVPLEAICILAKIEPSHLLGSALLALREHSVNRVKIIAITNHPDVLRKRVEYAMKPGGGRDRDALDTALGFLPTNKGTTIINKMFASAGPTSDAPKDDDDKGDYEDDIEYAFPDSTRMQEKLAPIRQRMLNDGKTE